MSDYFTSRKWNQELGYLSEIDMYRYSKHYLLPLCRKWLNVSSDNDLIGGRTPITDELIKKAVGFCVIGLHPGTEDCMFSFQFDTHDQILDEEDYLDLMDLDFHDLYSRIKEGAIIVNKELLKACYLQSKEAEYLMNGEEVIDITVQQVKEEGYHVDEITALATRIVDGVYSIWKNTYSYVNREDSFEITADINI